jgi:hypothetical protein
MMAKKKSEKDKILNILKDLNKYKPEYAKLTLEELTKILDESL